MVSHPDSTVAFREEKHAGCSLSLTHDAVFWHVEEDLHVTYQEIDKFLAGKEAIGGNCVHENMLCDFVPETRRDHLKE